MLIENGRFAGTVGLCVAICTRGTSPYLGKVLDRLTARPLPGVTIHVLIVVPDSRSQAIHGRVLPAGFRLSVISQGHAGYVAPRHEALRWTTTELPGWSVLFLDDDDVPSATFLHEMWKGHCRHPADLIAGVVVGPLRPGRRERRSSDRLVDHHGASALLLPESVLTRAIGWLPYWLNSAGGEDTALCRYARDAGLRIWQVPARAKDVRDVSQVPVDIGLRRGVHDAWIMGTLERRSVRGPGSRFPLGLRVVLKAVTGLVLLPACPARARALLAQAAGGTAGLLVDPPPRSWLFACPPVSPTQDR